MMKRVTLGAALLLLSLPAVELVHALAIGLPERLGAGGTRTPHRVLVAMRVWVCKRSRLRRTKSGEAG